MLTVEAVSREQRLCNYFENNVVNNPLFQPEAAVAAVINFMIQNTNDFTEVEATRLVAMLSSVEQVIHYNSSGWLE